MPLGAPVDEVPKRLTVNAIRKAPAEIGRDVAGREISEHHLARLLSRDELALHRLERMIVDDDLRWPIAGEKEESSGLAPASDHRDELDRRRIAPLEIAEDEHERSIGAEHIERLTHFVEQALAGRSCCTLPRGLRERRRKLPRPARRHAAYHLDHALALRMPAEPAEGLEDRKVRFACPVLFDALALTYEGRLRFRGDLPAEGFDQRRLADAGLTRHEDDLPLAAARSLVELAQLRQLGPSADE